MQRYLKSLEEWFIKWRLLTAVHKCSFTIYSKGPIPKELTNGEFKLIIFYEEISINHNPKYLGVQFDRHLNFNQHTEVVREKSLKALNVIKCLSYKKWSISTNDLLNVYKVLIRSKMEYAPQIHIVNSKNIERLNGIQYKALKTIFKEKFNCSSTFLHHLGSIDTLEQRVYALNASYMEKNILNSNPLIAELLSEIKMTKEKTTPIEILNLIPI